MVLQVSPVNPFLPKLFEFHAQIQYHYVGQSTQTLTLIDNVDIDHSYGV